MDSEEREREKALKNERAFKTPDFSQPVGDPHCHAPGRDVEHYSPVVRGRAPLQSAQLPEAFLHVCPGLHDGGDQPGPLPGHHETPTCEQQQAGTVLDWHGLAPQ